LIFKYVFVNKYDPLLYFIHDRPITCAPDPQPRRVGLSTNKASRQSFWRWSSFTGLETACTARICKVYGFLEYLISTPCIYPISHLSIVVAPPTAIMPPKRKSVAATSANEGTATPAKRMRNSVAATPASAPAAPQVSASCRG
jgi:hypothetical protein